MVSPETGGAELFSTVTWGHGLLLWKLGDSWEKGGEMGVTKLQVTLEERTGAHSLHVTTVAWSTDEL